jgi:type IV pilus assembly protein PilQ
MLVKDVPSVFPEIEKLLATLDTPTPQVLIEARIVEVNTSEISDLGIQWGGLILSPDGLSQIGGFSGLGTGPVTGSHYVVDFPSGALAGGGSGFTFGMLNPAKSMGLDLQLSAFETLGKLKIISNPRIITLDNKEAKILQGKSIPVRKLTTEGTISTEFKDVTLELTVQPHIAPDDTISMIVEIKKEELDPTLPSIEGVPGTDKKQALTSVIIANGETVVIGGVYKITKSHTTEGVPGLMKIPVLGWLFKSREIQTTTAELLIFITPRIVEQR